MAAIVSASPPQQQTLSPFIPLISRHLIEICTLSNSNLISYFHSAIPPPIPLQQYIERIARYYECSDEALILATRNISLIYSRIKGNSWINDLSIHRLFLTSFVLSSKFLEDEHSNNAYLAKVGGITCEELNKLEIEFLSIVNFDFYMSGDQYNQFAETLKKGSASIAPS